MCFLQDLVGIHCPECYQRLKVKLLFCFDHAFHWKFHWQEQVAHSSREQLLFEDSSYLAHLKAFLPYIQPLNHVMKVTLWFCFDWAFHWKFHWQEQVAHSSREQLLFEDVSYLVHPQEFLLHIQPLNHVFQSYFEFHMETNRIFLWYHPQGLVVL